MLGNQISFHLQRLNCDDLPPRKVVKSIFPIGAISAHSMASVSVWSNRTCLKFPAPWILQNFWRERGITKILCLSTQKKPSIEINCGKKCPFFATFLNPLKTFSTTLEGKNLSFPVKLEIRIFRTPTVLPFPPIVNLKVQGEFRLIKVYRPTFPFKKPGCSVSEDKKVKNRWYACYNSPPSFKKRNFNLKRKSVFRSAEKSGTGSIILNKKTLFLSDRFVFSFN